MAFRASCPDMRCDVVVIASDQRSGSTELAAELSARVGALNLGEYFNVWGGQIPLPRMCATAMLKYSHRAAHPLASVQRTRNACGRARAIVRLFPIIRFYTMTSPNRTMTELLTGPTCVIILERDPYARACSLTRVSKTGDWQSQRSSHPNCTGTVSNASRSMRSFAARQSGWFAAVRKLVRSVDPAQPVFEVRFEQLESRGLLDGRVSTRNATIDAMQRWVQATAEGRSCAKQ